jgi:hypothetical protein
MFLLRKTSNDNMGIPCYNSLFNDIIKITINKSLFIYTAYLKIIIPLFPADPVDDVLLLELPSAPPPAFP